MTSSGGLANHHATVWFGTLPAGQAPAHAGKPTAVTELPWQTYDKLDLDAYDACPFRFSKA